MVNNINFRFYTFQKKLRNTFSENEIFFETFSLLSQTNYSPKLKYFNYKRRLNNQFYTMIKNRCLFTKNSRTVFSKLKIAKTSFSQDISKLPGFYRSVW